MSAMWIVLVGAGVLAIGGLLLVLYFLHDIEPDED